MSEIRSSHLRQLAKRDSSVTRIERVEASLGASTAGAADEQATVISSRPPGSSSDAPPLLPPLEVGKLLEGEQLGQFELRQFVGGGGMGVVFRGWDKTLNREVAVKVLSSDQSTDEETLRRFRNEAQSAARLDHPNIARVHGMGEDRGVHYIIFEFIEGVNLRDLVDRHGQLPIDEAIDYTLQVAEALDHASQRDVIHRDIKPSNVLITAEGNAKLVDMGLARLHQVEHTNNDLTASGVTLGTFDYISPEQARDPRSADVRSDLYSLGCSLYFMLVGQPPFPNGTVLQKLLQHQGDPPPDPRNLRRELPSDLVRSVSRLLAKSPAQRHQSPAELIDDLSAIRDHLHKRPNRSPAAIRSFLRPRVPAAVRKRLPWALPLIVLILTSLALDFYWTRADRAAEILPEGPSLPKPAISSLGVADRKVVSSPAQPNESPEASTSSSSPAATAEPDASQAKIAATGHGNVASVDKQPVANKQQPPEKGPATGKPVGTTANSKVGLLTVGSSDDGATHATLQEAVRAAESGDVIELRYSGIHVSLPIEIEDKKLTSRAGDGFLPVIGFVSRDAATDDAPAAMFAVKGGSLSYLNVGIEWEVSADRQPSQWKLFDLQDVELLRFEKCHITLRKSRSTAGSAGDAAIVAVDAARSKVNAVEGGAVGAPAARQPITIEIQNCILRGEARLATVAEGTSARFVCDNSLLALAGQVLDLTAPTGASQQARVEFEARHLTLDAGRGLLTVSQPPENASNLTVDLRVVDSILRTAPGFALIEQRGSQSTEGKVAGISWSGNRNFYEGFDIFWLRHDGRSESTGLNFADWKAYWGPSSESNSHQNAVVWNLPIARDRRASETVPADLALATSTADNPARDAASDGLDAGCLLDLLPTLP
jgi:serine/threonine-protein kinase